MRLFGSATRYPGSPAARMIEPIDMAIPTQLVWTGALMYCITS